MTNLDLDTPAYTAFLAADERFLAADLEAVNARQHVREAERGRRIADVERLRALVAFALEEPSSLERAQALPLAHAVIRPPIQTGEIVTVRTGYLFAYRAEQSLIAAASGTPVSDLYDRHRLEPDTERARLSDPSWVHTISLGVSLGARDSEETP